MLLKMDQVDRSADARVAGGSAVIVLFQATLGIGGPASIVGAVRAEEDIDEIVHRAVTCNCKS